MIVFCSIILGTNACINIETIEGSGKVITENRDLKGFKGIKASSGLMVYISQGDTEKVEIKADDNIVKLIKTEVKGDMLYITCEKNLKNTKSRNIYITAKEINSIEGSAGVEIKTTNQIKSKAISLSSSSGASVIVEIESAAAKCKTSSGATLIVSGKTIASFIQSSSGSSFNGFELECETSDAEASSGSTINIFANKAITAKASSGASVLYKGSPDAVTKKASSGGSIKGI
ncbi:MAG: hypothetical protein A2275_07520 [Bacteroidetes bacterium RIFOXYA12_FULL_35_11]|nr:MAG: hypothetical protein A2X01_04240 [Bacteroidetes bacterium GWF2_35_48]OFY73137.1 MAG: hypothetical protein A2275_07520 [Bacteroidetes bacterium RIFOXYA12_FULL_35_11]OFY95840.1 MAG: hypothetical protein A2491_14890 [Bacteroidetes bacterium RIFOXYC12_FULL_35_7]